MMGLELTNESKFYLKETAKWAKFLSILGFVFMGLMVIAGIFIGSFMSKMTNFSSFAMPFPSSLLSIMYIVIAVLYFMPCYYLYQFAVKTKTAGRIL